MITKGKSFEYETALALNRCFKEEKINAIAYRKFNFRFTKQGFDILVDSCGIKYYLALECKSITLPGKNGVYFSCCSADKNGKSQIESENEFLKFSGRAGIMAVEVKNKDNKFKAAYLLPWSVVWNCYISSNACVSLDDIKAGVEVNWIKGGYKIKSEDLRTINSLIPLGRSRSRRVEEN